MLGKSPLQKERVYLNAEFMDLLDFTAGIFGVSASEILRFSLKGGNDAKCFKKSKRAQSNISKQKRAKASKKEGKKQAHSHYCLPYFASVESLANRSAAQPVCICQVAAVASA